MVETNRLLGASVLGKRAGAWNTRAGLSLVLQPMSNVEPTTHESIEHDRTRVPVAGGVLVYESRPVGRELVGFEDVTDWEDVRSALAARGVGVGAVHHLPVLDD